MILWDRDPCLTGNKQMRVTDRQGCLSYGGYVLQQSIDHLLHRDPLRFGAIANEDSMPQRGMNQRANIVGGSVVAASQQSPRFRAQDHVLPGPRSRAPTD